MEEANTSRSLLIPLDKRKRILNLDVLAEQVEGIKTKALVGKSVGKLFELLEAPEDQIKALLADKTVIQGVFVSGFWGESRQIVYSINPSPAWMENKSAFILVITILFPAITEKTKEQADLNLDLFHTLVNMTPSGTVIHQDGKVIFANPAAARILGAGKPEDLYNRSIFDVVHPDYVEVVKQRVGKMLGEKTGAPPIEEVFIRSDGENVDVEVVATSILFNNKPAIQVEFRDITERKKAQQKLRESENLYRTLNETSPDAIVVGDIEGNVSLVNYQTARMLGYEDAGQLIGKSCFSAVCPEDLPRVYADAVIFRKKGILRDVEYHLLRKDGSVITAEISTTLLDNEKDEPHSFIAVVRDITKRKESEDALRQSEERYRALVEAAPDAIVVTDMNGKVLMANQQTARLGLVDDASELLGTDGYNFIIPDDRERALSDLIVTVKEGINKGAVYKLQRKDGSIIDSEMNIVLLHDDLGNPIGFITMIRDISDRIKAELELKSRHDILEAMNRSAEVFLQVGDWEDALNTTCMLLGEATHASRSYVFKSSKCENGDLAFSQLFEWCREGIPSSWGRTELQNLSLSDIGVSYALEGLKKNKTFSSLVKDLPLDIRELLSSELVQSLLITPILSGKELWGFLGFDDCEQERQWSDAEIEALRAAAGFIGKAVESSEAQKLLKQSEETALAMLNATTDAALLIDTEGNVIAANEALAFELNVTREKLIGKNIFRFLSSGMSKSSYAQLNELLRTGKPIRCLDKSGPRWFDDSAYPIFDEQGKVRQIAFFSRNITEQKKAEDRLLMEKERTQTLLVLNQMTNATLKEIVDYVLEEAVRITQSKLGYIAFYYEETQVLAMHSWSKSAMRECEIENKPIEYPLSTTGLWGEAVRQRKPVITNDYESEKTWKKGYPKGHVEITRHMNVPIFDGDRLVLLIGVGNREFDYCEDDVIQLRLLLEGMWGIVQRHRAEEALTTSEERLRLAMEAANEGLWDWNMEAHEFHFSPRYYVMLGYKEDEFPASFESWVNLLHPEDRTQVLGVLYGYLESPIGVYTQEYRMLAHDGTWRWILSSGKVVSWDSSGIPLRLVGTHVDITEHKEMAENQRLTLERVQLQQTAVVQMAKAEVIAEGNFIQAISAINEIVAKALDVDKVIVWLLNEDGNEIRCIDYYDKKEGKHGSGKTFHAVDYPKYFSMLDDVRVVESHDLRTDAFFSEFYEDYFVPNDITAAIDSAIRISGKVVGVISLEHLRSPREWYSDEVVFVGETTDQIAQALINSYRRKTEEALRESEEKYRTLFETSSDGIFIMSDVFLDCNNQATILFEADKNGIVGHSPVDFSPEYQPDGKYSSFGAACNIESAMEGKPQHFYWLHSSAKGKLIDCEVTLNSLPVQGQKLLVATVRDITERKKTEAWLLRTRSQMQAILDNLPYLAWLKDVDCNFINVSKAFAEAFGFKHPEELVGKSDFDICGNDLARKYQADDFEVMENRKQKLVEEPIEVNKENRWFETFKTPVFDVDGNVIGTTGVARDITDQKIADAEKQAAMERIQREQSAIYSISINSALISGDLENAVMFLTETVSEALRVERVSIWMLSENNYELICFDAFDRLANTHPTRETLQISESPVYLSALENNRVLDFFDESCSFKVFNSQKKYLLKHGISARLDSAIRVAGKIVGIVCIEHIREPYKWHPDEINFAAEVADQTAQAVLNQHRKQAELALRRSEERFRMVSEQSLVGITIYQPDRFIYANPAAAEITGMTIEEITNMDGMAFLDKVHPDDAKMVAQELAETMTRPGYGSDFIYRFLHKNGSFITLEIFTRNIEIGDKSSSIGVFIDITEKQNAEIMRQKLLNELANRNRELEEFVYSISHDLKTPLATIMGYTEMLNMDQQFTKEEELACLTRIESAARRMVRLIDDLLALSRAGKVSKPSAWIDLNTLVDEAFTSLSFKAAHNAVQLKKGENLPTLFIDQSRMLQVLTNLVDNAIKYSNPDTHAYVLIEYEEMPHEHRFFVEDNGVGIDKAYHEKIFSVFYRLSDEGQEGTGIGLSLVRKILESMGGRIWVESEIGQGSRFYFTLPR